MTRSTLATRTSGNAGQYSSRRGAKIKGWIIHHAASTSLGSVLGMMSSASRQLSANYVVSGSDVVSVVPEEYRAWTSSSPKGDGERLTVEIVNDRVGSNDSNWTISDASYEAMAKLIADTSKRYGFAINRSTIIGHREVRGIYGEGYATACPSGIDLDRLVALARKYQTGKATGASTAPSTSKPAAAPAKRSSWSAKSFGIAEVEPTKAQWKTIQTWLKKLGRYNGPADGVPGQETWKGIQTTVKKYGYYEGVSDGYPGINTAKGMQRYAANGGGYKGRIDGKLGANSWAGFIKRLSS